MIDAKNLMTHAQPQLDATKHSHGKSADSLSLLAGGAEEKKDDAKDPNTLDPNAFIMMLSQVLSNVSTADASAAPESNPEEVQSALLSELTNTIASSSIPLTEDGSTAQVNSALTPLINTAAQELNSSLATTMPVETENPALSWLEAQAFQSLKGTNQPADTSLTAAETEVEPLSTQPLVQGDTDLLAQKSSETVLIATSTPANQPKAFEQNGQALAQLSTATIAELDNSPLKDMAALDSDSSPNLANTAPPVPMPVQQTASTAPQTPTVTPKTLDIPVHLSHPQWGDKFADHIVWLGQNDIKSAFIKINPEELGPLEISIKVSKDVASVQIISHSIHVKDIVDQAIPRLREMMAEQGLNLSDVQVNAEQRSASQFARGEQQGEQQSEAYFVDSPEEEVQMVTTIKKPPKRLIDYFA